MLMPVIIFHYASTVAGKIFNDDK